jgi:hypothetical protein
VKKQRLHTDIPILSQHEISTAKKGKLNSFNLAANHEKEVGQDTRRRSRQFYAVRICLP